MLRPVWPLPQVSRVCNLLTASYVGTILERPLLLTMLVSDVMTRDVIGVAPEATVDMVAKLFAEEAISGVPVLSGDGRPLGLVTKALVGAPERDGTTAREVMTPMMVTVAPNATIVAATKKLLETGVHHLLVVDDDFLVGIVTTMDLIRGFARSARSQGMRDEEVRAH